MNKNKMKVIPRYLKRRPIPFSLLIGILIFYAASCSAEEMSIKLKQPESEIDIRDQYVTSLLLSALDKTLDEFGSYKVHYAASSMTPLREQVMLAKGDQINLSWFPAAQTLEFGDRLIPVPVPIMKGLLGYRVFLIHRKNQEKFNTIHSLDALRKLTVGQREGWGDIGIFQHNGFTVIEGNTYEGLFGMTVAGRFDYFSRGVSEALRELKERQQDYPDLELEQSILLYYPYPTFFYVNKRFPLLAQRIHTGLSEMLKDGSFDKLFIQYHGKQIEAAKLKKRKLFKLESKNLPDYVPLDKPEMWFNPLDF